jgi:putative flippase GtrA
MMPTVTGAEPLVGATEEAPGQLPAATSPSTARSLPRFLIIGALSFILDAGTLFLTHGLLHIWLPLATTLAYAVAFTVNFSLNRLWTFGSTAALTGQATRYLVLIGVNYLITLLMVNGLAAIGISYLLAKVMSTAVIAVINYIAYRNWVFRPPGSSEPATSATASQAPTP